MVSHVFFVSVVDDENEKDTAKASSSSGSLNMRLLCTIYVKMYQNLKKSLNRFCGVYNRYIARRAY